MVLGKTMSRILVTGASGFVGGHLVAWLVKRGDQVRCLVRPTSRTKHLESLDVELVHGDMAKGADWQSVLDGVEVVYHVAGKTCALRARELNQVNAAGTYELARACARRTSPPTLLLMSSLAAAGPSRWQQPRVESERPRPISNYGRSKRAGERAAQAWADEVPLTIVRPGIVFGPYNREMLPIFRSVLRFRVHAVPGFQASRVSLIHIDDLVEITIRAAQLGARISRQNEEDEFSGTGIYFACAPEQPTYAELGRIIGRALGRRNVLLVHLPGPIPWLAAAGNQLAAILRGLPDTFNLDKMREATAGSWTGSPETVRRELDFSPPLPIGDRMSQTVRWYLDSGWL